MEYTKGECAFIGCAATAKFLFETIELAADRGYGVIVEPIGGENNRVFNLYQITPQKARASPDLYEALKSWDELRAMHPLDSGADIDEIFQECCRITDKAIAKVEGGQDDR